MYLAESAKATIDMLQDCVDHLYLVEQRLTGVSKAQEDIDALSSTGIVFSR